VTVAGTDLFLSDRFIETCQQLTPKGCAAIDGRK
jgi:hypothetical protein